jgi:hypothetical protein
MEKQQKYCYKSDHAIMQAKLCHNPIHYLETYKPSTNTFFNSTGNPMVIIIDFEIRKIQAE